MIKKILLLFICLLLTSAISLSQSNDFRKNNLMVNSSKRVTVDLSGTWEVSYDEEDSWEDTYIPKADFNKEKIVYRKNIDIPKQLLSKYKFHLKLLGISDNAGFFINQQFVGNHFGGLTEFDIDIPTKFLRSGKNEFKIVVTSPESYAAQIQKFPPLAQRPYVGISRNIILYGTSPSWVEDLKLKYKFNSNNLNSVNIDLKSSITSDFGESDGEGLPIVVRASFRTDSGNYRIIGEKKIIAKNSRTLEQNFKANISNIKKWSPSQPNLYDIKIEIISNGSVIDDIVETVGFRDITIVAKSSGSKIYLNKQPLEIKAVNYIDDYKGRGNALIYSRYEKDINEIKRLGANTVRVKYNTPHPYFVQLCAQKGLMLLIDLPAYSVPAGILNTDEVKVRMKNIADRLYNSFENSPAFLSWGTYSNSDETAKVVTDYSKFILSLLRKKSDKLFHKSVMYNTDEIVTNDYDFLIVDFNNRTDDYTKVAQKFVELRKPVEDIPLLAEYGVPISPDNYNGYSDKLSLEYQANYLLNFYNILSANGSAGNIINSFNDYLLSLPILETNIDNKFLFTGGLLDRERKERIAYKAVKAAFNKEKEPLLNAGSEEIDDSPIAFLITGIIIGVIFLFMINRFRRFREYFFRSLLRPYNFYADVRDQRLISTFQTVILALLNSISVANFLAVILYELRFDPRLDYFINILIPSSVIKENLFSIIWKPVALIFVLTLTILLLLFLIALFLRFIAFVLSVRTFYRDTITITAWAGIPAILLLPVSIFLSRVVSGYPESLIIWVGLIGLIIIWSFMRLFKSSSVVFDKPSGKVYLTELVSLVVILGIPLLIFQLNRSFIDYLIYLFTVLA